MSDYGSPPPPPYGAMPPGSYQQPGGPPPPNYLVWAILATIFCCLPLGIPAIVFASQVNSKWQTGDFSGAQEASRKAKQFSLWSTIAGVVVGVLYALLIVAGAVGSNS
jgi:ABC-type sulfate transport system permease component